MARDEFLAPVNNENLMARGGRTLRENPGPPGRGLSKGLTTHSLKNHVGYRRASKLEIQPLGGWRKGSTILWFTKEE